MEILPQILLANPSINKFSSWEGGRSSDLDVVGVKFPALEPVVVFPSVPSRYVTGKNTSWEWRNTFQWAMAECAGSVEGHTCPPAHLCGFKCPKFISKDTFKHDFFLNDLYRIG